MATYMDAVNGQHTDGSEQDDGIIIPLVTNVQQFEFKVHQDRIEELGDCQSVVDLDFDPTNDDVETVSDECYEYQQVI